MKNLLLTIPAFLLSYILACNVNIQQKEFITNSITAHTNIDSCSSDTSRLVVEKKGFIIFWEKFSCAILEHDTITLSSIINDKLKGGCCFIPFQEYDSLQNYDEEELDKSIFLNKIDSLFHPPYLQLLKRFNIEKGIISLKSTDWKDKYTIFEQENYYASLHMEENNIITYKMGHLTDYGHSDIYLQFIKTIYGYKLYGFSCIEFFVNS